MELSNPSNNTLILGLSSKKELESSLKKFQDQTIQFNKLIINNSMLYLSAQDLKNFCKVGIKKLEIKNFKFNKCKDMEIFLSLIDELKITSLTCENFLVEILDAPYYLEKYFYIKQGIDDENYLYSNLGHLFAIKELILKNCPLLYISDFFSLLKNHSNFEELKIDNNSFIIYTFKIEKITIRNKIIELVYNDDLIIPQGEQNIIEFLNSFPEQVEIESFKFKNVINLPQNFDFAKKMKIKKISFVNCCHQFLKLILKSLNYENSILETINFVRIPEEEKILQINLVKETKITIKDSNVQFEKVNNQSINLKEMKYQLNFLQFDSNIFKNIGEVDTFIITINQNDYDISNFSPGFKIRRLELRKMTLSDKFNENCSLVSNLMKNNTKIEISFLECEFTKDFAFSKNQCEFSLDFYSFNSLIFRDEKIQNFRELLLSSFYANEIFMNCMKNLNKRKLIKVDKINIVYETDYQRTLILLTLLSIFYDNSDFNGDSQVSSSNFSIDTSQNRKKFYEFFKDSLIVLNTPKNDIFTIKNFISPELSHKVDEILKNLNVHLVATNMKKLN